MCFKCALHLKLVIMFLTSSLWLLFEILNVYGT